MSRQPDNLETLNRLRSWDKGSTSSERMAAQILHSDGFLNIDPSHPSGGRDGKKDIKCSKDGVNYIAACYFAKGQKTFREIKKKFSEDVKCLSDANIGGFAFVTNQELSLKERETLTKLAGAKRCDIYHLERVSAIMNMPSNFGHRAEYLQIEMTLEEQISYSQQTNDTINRLISVIESMQTSQTVGKITTPVKYEVEHEYDFGKSFHFNNDLIKDHHKCSYCKFGFRLEKSINMGKKTPYGIRDYSTYYSNLTSLSKIRSSTYRIKCPQCDSIDSVTVRFDGMPF